MGGRIVDLLSTPHLSTEALLPWLLNDTLTGSERRKVEAHLQSCAQCRAELAQQRQLMARYTETVTPDPGLDLERALGSMHGRLLGEPTRRALPRPASPAAWWRFGVAVQLAAILALGVTALFQLATSRQDDDVAAYRGLADPVPRTTGDALVVFDPDASEAQVRSALQRRGARIVDGPTAAGAYVVRFDGAADAARLAALRSESVIVRVEALSAPR